MSTLYRATVTRIDGEGVFVEVPELGEGGEWGPLELLAITLAQGDSVLVGSINETLEDLALLGKLVTTNPAAPYSPPSNGREVYYYEDETDRNAAPIAWTSGTLTWCDNQQRLDIYTDEGTPGWVWYFGIKNNNLLYPQSTKIGIGSTSPNGAIDYSAPNSTSPLLASGVSGDTFGRVRFFPDGKLEIGPGNAARDTTLSRAGVGMMQLNNQLGVGNGSPASTATYTARQSTNRVGYFSNNTEVGVTHGLAHFYSIEAGNTDSSFIASYMSSETQPRFYVKTDGEHRWGPGGSTVTDTNLYRSGANILATDDSFSVAGDLNVTFDADIAGNVFLGPSGRNLGRGAMLGESLTTQGGTILPAAGEVIVITGVSQTYRAGRAYRLFIEGKVRYVTATTQARFRVRKTDLAGAVLMDFGLYPVVTAPATNTDYPVCYTGTFTVTTDVTAALMLTLTCPVGSAAFSGVGGPSRGMYPVDVGIAADHLNLGSGLPILS